MDKEWRVLLKDLLINLVPIAIILLILTTVGIWSLKLIGNEIIEIKENYEKNIIVEIETGLVIDSTKETVQGILFGDIKYETAINIDGEIVISNDKEIYYKSLDNIGKEVEVDIKNNKSIEHKVILDVKEKEEEEEEEKVFPGDTF